MGKILMIADTKIYGYGGGSNEERKNYDALKFFSDKYGSEFKVIALDPPDAYAFPYKLKKNRFIDICSRLCLHSTYIFMNWIKLKKEVLRFGPDILFLGRSRMGFIAKDVKRSRSNAQIVCFMANIECDYVDGYFANKNSRISSLYKALEKRCVFRDEKNAIKYSDELLYLTERDANRSVELYSADPKKKNILPICVKDTVELEKTSSKRTVVFVGSLGYESNVESLTWFVREVWKPHFESHSNIDFIVGGSKPSENLKRFLKDVGNLTLYENFRSQADIIPKESMIVAPILTGAGMKVKVAEALSMGLSIVASEEALVGYENAIINDKLGGVLQADSVEQYVDAINNYLSMSSEKLERIKKQNQELFRKYYSYDVSRSIIEQVIVKWADAADKNS